MSGPLGVVPLPPPNARVIEVLEVALERARTGMLADVAIVGVQVDRQIWNINSGLDRLALAGAVAIAGIGVINHGWTDV